MNISIRHYQTKDTQAILDIINDNILHSTSLYDYQIRTFEQQKNILEEKINKGFPVIVAEKDGSVLGFGMYSEFRFREAYKFTVEHSVYVNQDFQHKGIGLLLLIDLIRLAKEQGLHTMIGAIDAENLGSIRFHEKLGFKVCGTISEVGYKFDHWLDLVLMQLILK